MRSYKRLIGILGGMGPAATIDFMSKIVAATPADLDQDHVPLIVHDVPQIPDRSAAIQEGSDAPFLPMLSGVRLLDAAGVEFIVIPCNTAHNWHSRLARGCRASIIHIADAVREHIELLDRKPRSLAIMGTRGTIAAGIYTQRGVRQEDAWCVPCEQTQRLIDRAIGAVKAGDIEGARPPAEEAVQRLVQSGADSVLLACTELPVALANAHFNTALVIDATDALAHACVRASFGSVDLARAG